MRTVISMGWALMVIVGCSTDTGDEESRSNTGGHSSGGASIGAGGGSAAKGSGGKSSLGGSPAGGASLGGAGTGGSGGSAVSSSGGGGGTLAGGQVGSGGASASSAGGTGGALQTPSGGDSSLGGKSTGGSGTGGATSSSTGGSGTGGAVAAARADVGSLAVLAEDGQVVLTWKEPSADSTLTGIEVSVVGKDVSLVVPKGTEKVTVSDLSNQAEHTFVVRTVGVDGAKSPGVAIGARADFVKVEGGTFQQGTTDATVVNSYPAHSVTVSSFYVGKYEVTYAEYDEFAEVTGRKKPDDKGWGRGLRPVQYVNWFNVVAYANWRSLKEGLVPVYAIDEKTPDPRNVTGDTLNQTVTAQWDANGYRLPTEAEWEFAATGGNLSKGYKFSGSNLITDVAWSGADSAAGIGGTATSHPIGTKKPNELGLYDFTGNVGEFLWDAALNSSRANYSATAQTNPKGPEGNYDRRVARGAGSMAGESCSSNIARHFLSPTKECMVGFRLARTVKGDL